MTSMTASNKFFKKIYRILSESAYNFWEDDCYTKSAALTFYTLQSIVPFLAVLLAVAKSVGFQGYLEHILSTTFAGPKEAVGYALQIANVMLQETRGGLIAGAGLILLLYTNITLLGYIELALNRIWKIKRSRTFSRKISDYIATVIICPLILIASSSLTFYLKTELQSLGNIGYLQPVSEFLLWSFKLLPLVLSWILFFLLYFLMPNEKLKVWPRVIAGIFAGTVFQLWQIVYFNLQIQIFNYSVTYGALAVLPLLLIWLQISWVIALFGAELAANLEADNLVHAEDSEERLEKLSKRELGLLIVYECVKAFSNGQAPPSNLKLAQSLKTSLDSVQRTLDLLVQGNILTKIQVKKHPEGYHPLFDPARMTIKNVVDALIKENEEDIYTLKTPERKKLCELLNEFDTTSAKAPQNVSLDKLVF